jgi:hypothetical protein
MPANLRMVSEDDPQLAAVVRAICPLVKPFLDGPDASQTGRCDCDKAVATAYGAGGPLCYAVMREIVQRALEANRLGADDLSSAVDAAIRMFGDYAAIEVAMRADARLDAGDLEGRALWLQLLKAIEAKSY